MLNQTSSALSSCWSFSELPTCLTIWKPESPPPPPWPPWPTLSTAPTAMNTGALRGPPRSRTPTMPRRRTSTPRPWGRCTCGRARSTHHRSGVSPPKMHLAEAKKVDSGLIKKLAKVTLGQAAPGRQNHCHAQNLAFLGTSLLVPHSSHRLSCFLI